MRLPISPFMLSALSLSLAAPSASSQEKDGFAIRTVLVSVKDEKGTPVPALAAEDFKVTEGTVPRDVTEVAPEDKGREVLLLVDTSLAFLSEVQPLRRSLQAFVSAVRVEDQITLYEYGQRPRRIVGPTGDRLALRGAMGNVRAWTGEAAYLLDAIAEAARVIGARERPEGDPPEVVIVGSTGPDLSHTHYRRAEELGEKSGAGYHAVIFEVGASASLARHGIEETLYALTEKRGGTLKRLLSVSAMEPELGRLAALLLQPRYRVSFLTEASQPRDSKTLSISVDKDGVRAEILRLLPGEKKVTPSSP